MPHIFTSLASERRKECESTRGNLNTEKTTGGSDVRVSSFSRTIDQYKLPANLRMFDLERLSASVEKHVPQQ